jgi:hypothetical protein
MKEKIKGKMKINLTESSQFLRAGFLFIIRYDFLSESIGKITFNFWFVIRLKPSGS